MQNKQPSPVDVYGALQKEMTGLREAILTQDPQLLQSWWLPGPQLSPQALDKDDSEWSPRTATTPCVVLNQHKPSPEERTFWAEVDAAARLAHNGEHAEAHSAYNKLYWKAVDHGWSHVALHMLVEAAVCLIQCSGGPDVSMRTRALVAKAHRLRPAEMTVDPRLPLLPEVDEQHEPEVQALIDEAGVAWRRAVVRLGRALDVRRTQTFSQDFEVVQQRLESASRCMEQALRLFDDLVVESNSDPRRVWMELAAALAHHCSTDPFPHPLDMRSAMEQLLLSPRSDLHRLPGWLMRWWELLDAVMLYRFLELEDADYWDITEQVPWC